MRKKIEKEEGGQVFVSVSSALLLMPLCYELIASTLEQGKTDVLSK